MPRSPSRDLSDRFTGKRGYFRRPDTLRRGRIALTWVAVLAAVAWAVVDVAKPAQRVQFSHSHGRLANVHAAFDNNCEACHKAHSVSLNPADVFKARDRWHDLTCEKCHAGPPHHASANKDALDFHNRCSNCHHDHEGRLNSLVRLNDKDCNWCHMDLGKYHRPEMSDTKQRGEQPYTNKVTNFVTDHPEFRALTTFKPESRTLKFSHAVHMSPGQVASGDGMTVKRLHDLNRQNAEAVVARYAPGAVKGGGVDEAMKGVKIQLDCASCHALDAGAGTPEFEKLKGVLRGAPAAALLPRAEGAYFLPVNFEAHCRSCHPLSANEAVANEPGAGKGKVDKLLPRFEVPHRIQPADFGETIRAGYLKALLSDDPSRLRKKDPQLGGKLDPADPLNDRDGLRAEADALAKRAEGLLFGGGGMCSKCHLTEPGAEPRQTKVKPVPDRTVWFKHAKFNHASHRGATCATCHPGTETPQDVSKPIVELEPAQIVGVDTCRACHSPPGTTVKLSETEKIAGGGARHACTDCHRYHNGDNPYEGRGARARETGKPLSLKDWLTGSIEKN